MPLKIRDALFELNRVEDSIAQLCKRRNELQEQISNCQQSLVKNNLDFELLETVIEIDVKDFR